MNDSKRKNISTTRECGRSHWKMTVNKSEPSPFNSKVDFRGTQFIEIIIILCGYTGRISLTSLIWNYEGWHKTKTTVFEMRLLSFLHIKNSPVNGIAG